MLPSNVIYVVHEHPPICSYLFLAGALFLPPIIPMIISLSIRCFNCCGFITFKTQKYFFIGFEYGCRIDDCIRFCKNTINEYNADDQFRRNNSRNGKQISGKFVLQYDRQKLEDYVRKGLLKHYIGLVSSESRFLKIPTEMYDEMRNQHLEEARGDTVFMLLGRTECYVCHYETADSLDRYCSGIYKYIDSWIGWIVADENIYDMYRRTEMEEDSSYYSHRTLHLLQSP